MVVISTAYHYFLKKGSGMVNNSTNINKTDNHFSPQSIEHKKDHVIWCWDNQVLAWVK